MHVRPPELKILICLMNSDKPMKLNWIIRKTGLGNRVVFDSIKKMLSKGTILLIKSDNKKYYTLQKIFKDELLVKHIYDTLTDVFDDTSRFIDFEHSDAPPEITLKNCLIDLICIFRLRLETIETKRSFEQITK